MAKPSAPETPFQVRVTLAGTLVALFDGDWTCGVPERQPMVNGFAPEATSLQLVFFVLTAQFHWPAVLKLLVQLVPVWFAQTVCGELMFCHAKMSYVTPATGDADQVNGTFAPTLKF